MMNAFRTSAQECLQNFAPQKLRPTNGGRKPFKKAKINKFQINISHKKSFEIPVKLLRMINQKAPIKFTSNGKNFYEYLTKHEKLHHP